MIAASAKSTLEVSDGVSLSTSPQNFRTLVEHPPRRVRFLAGYAGWGAHQLESELAQGAWLTADVTPELVFDTQELLEELRGGNADVRSRVQAVHQDLRGRLDGLVADLADVESAGTQESLADLKRRLALAGLPGCTATAMSRGVASVVVSRYSISW